MGICALFVLVVSLSASAEPINSFSGITLSNGDGTTVLGSFTFDHTTSKFSNVSRSFGENSMFEGVKVTNKYTSGYSISEGSFSGESFSDDSHRSSSDEKRRHHGCEGRKDCDSVPEGGTGPAYLTLSAIAVFAGILVSRKQRRITRFAQSR